VSIANVTEPVEGEDLVVQANVTNTGGESDIQSVTLDAGALGDDSTIVSLDPDEATTVTLSVGTETGDAGVYEIVAGTNDDEDSQNVSVLEPAMPALTGLDIAGQGANGTIAQSVAANVSVMVTNVGGATAPLDATLTVGTTVNRTLTTDALASGENATVTFENVTGGLAPGEYPVNVSAGPDTVTGTVTVENVTEALTFLEQRVGANDTVTVQNVSSGGVAGTVLVTYEAGGEQVIAGVETATLAQQNLTVTLAENIGYPADYEAHLVPAAATSGNYTAGETLSQATLNATVANDTARVTTVTGAPDIEVVEGQPARDTTGDGLLNDVRGDGSFDIFDVQSLFNNLNGDAVQDNPSYFNFQGSEPPSVGVFDVQSLFEQV